MDKNRLRQIIIDQHELFNKEEDLIERDTDLDYYLKGNEIVVISGIRRCGKSSLLKIISRRIKSTKIFVNFDDIRLTEFNIDDFQNIEDICVELYGEQENITYFLDEIQNVKFWEKWVNNLYSREIKVFVTGSNSNLLSSEISTHLTGRNKVLKLFPFSFKEFLRFKKIDKIDLKILTSTQKSKIYKYFLEYFNNGGFPLILKNNDLELSGQYFEDILNKDILNRYKVKETKGLKDLIIFLFSNVGRIYSYSTLQKVSGIKSLSTIKNYIDYFENVFLLNKVGLFDYSIKKQMVSSTKIYAMDNSFLKTIAFNFLENAGHRLENLVFLQLLRMDNDVYYHFGKKKCDFVIKKNLKIVQAVQVSLELSNPITKKREVDGLLDAMGTYKLNEGLILTLENEESFINDDKKIIIKPVWKWLLE